MPRDENAPLEDSSGGLISLRKAVVPLAASKLVNQSNARVSHPPNTVQYNLTQKNP